MRRVMLGIIVLVVAIFVFCIVPVRADDGEFIDDGYVLIKDDTDDYGYRFVERESLRPQQMCYSLPKIYVQQQPQFFVYIPLVFKADVDYVPARPTPTPAPIVTPTPSYSPLSDEYIKMQYGPQVMGVEEALSIYTRAYTQVARIAILDSGWSPIEDQPTNDIEGWNYFTDDSDTADDDTHGYHVQSIVSAPHNEVGIAGICPHCETVHLKVCESGRCSLRVITLAIDWCIENDVDIISMSFGGYGDPQVFAWRMMENALKRARENGILPIAAAGNYHEDALLYPAGFDCVVSVGGVDKNLDLAFFSNYGEELDFVAPSYFVYAYTSPTDTGYKSGTSMATPHVSAAAGVAKSLHPELTPDEIQEALIASSCDLGDTGRDDTFGWGMPTISSMARRQ